MGQIYLLFIYLCAHSGTAHLFAYSTKATRSVWIPFINHIIIIAGAIARAIEGGFRIVRIKYLTTNLQPSRQFNLRLLIYSCSPITTIAE